MGRRVWVTLRLYLGLGPTEGRADVPDPVPGHVRLITELSVALLVMVPNVFVARQAGVDSLAWFLAGISFAAVVAEMISRSLVWPWLERRYTDGSADSDGPS